MNYLLDKKAKRKKMIGVALAVVFVGVIIYWRTPVFGALSRAAGVVFHPVLSFGGNLSEKVSGFGAFFSSKNSLSLENENLKEELAKVKAKMENYDAILDENLTLKETLGRPSAERDLVLAAILSKPSQSIYGTIVIDVGIGENITEGNLVFAEGVIPIGRVAEANSSSAKVVLFSNPEEKTEASLNGTYLNLVGRGGGNFEMDTPRDLILLRGEEVLLPGITPYVIGRVEAIISDPREAFQKVLLTSPVNIQELRFVQVEIGS